MRIKTEPVTIDDVEYQTEIGTISGTMLGIEDHGILTFFVYIDYKSGSSQGAGGFALDGAVRTASGNDYIYPAKKHRERKGSIGAAIIIRRILEVVGVSNWEDLKGNYVVALIEGGYIRGLMSMSGEDCVIFADCFKWDKK